MDSGALLGSYEIVGPLGAGGMGEVYRARDRSLQREVAIKVLPAELASDPERLARLEREAQLLASLEHPNVASVYGLEEADGVRFLVMQLAAGETLADRLAAGAVPVEEVVEIAAQIAAGLEAAHERGVVHRDLKPANLMVSPEGEVKILDFGLAKALAPDRGADGSGGDLTASPTVMGATAAGVILGTAAYMSPEQARGKPLDRRTDLWSFGCVLFEMLSGDTTFGGETVTDVMAAIVTREPDWERLPAGTPDWMRALLRRCLEKKPRQRLADAGEARVVLETSGSAWAAANDAQATKAPETVDRRGWWAAAAVAILAVGSLWWALASPSPSVGPLYVALERGVEADQGMQSVDEDSSHVAVSPDGREVAFATRSAEQDAIWVRRIDEPEAIRLPSDAAGMNLAWNPAGDRLAFSTGSDIRLFDFRSGAASVRHRTDRRLSRPSWSPDGRLLVADYDGTEVRILELPATGDPVVLVTPRDSTARIDLLHPIGGGRFLVSFWNQAHGHMDTAFLNAEGELGAPLLHLGAGVEFATPDLLVFAREGSLWAQRVDLDGEALVGEPVALIAEIDTAPVFTPWLSVGYDVLSYRVGVGSEAPTILEWVDRGGQLIEAVGEAGNYYDPRVSPDGGRYVFDLSNEGDAGDIWVADVSGLPSRLTAAAADETRPVWAPDGAAIVLETPGAEGEGRLFRKPVDDPSAELESLGADAGIRYANDWVGETIVGLDRNIGEIWIVDARTGDSRPYKETRFQERSPDLSPDGSWVAYASDETGRFEIWLESFPEPGQRLRVSETGGEHPVWRSGDELFYRDAEDYIVAVPVLSTAPIALGEPERLFRVELRAHDIRQYDVTPDGQRFLLNRAVELPDLPIRLLIGWRQELARKAGPGW